MVANPAAPLRLPSAYLFFAVRYRNLPSCESFWCAQGVWGAVGRGSGLGSEPSATIYTQRVIQQVRRCCTTQLGLRRYVALCCYAPPRSHLPRGDSQGISSALDKSVMHTQVVNEYQVKSLVDAPCGALAWQPQMLEAIGKLQPDFRQASLRAQALLAQYVRKSVGNLLSVK